MALRVGTEAAADQLSFLLMRQERLGGIRSKKRRKDLSRARPWCLRNNLVGLGVASKSTLGRPTDETALKFYVRQKLAPSRLSPEERIPEWLEMDSVEGRFLTDVGELDGFAVAQQGQRFRPVPPGAGVGHFRGTSGTLGLLVRRRQGPDRPLMLSCSHVLALGGSASVGDPIEQPADFDLQVGPNQVAVLTPWFSRIHRNRINIIDAALALPGDARIVRPEIFGLNSKPSGILNLSARELQGIRGVPLVRSGTGSGLRSGALESIRSTFRIAFPSLNKTAVFRNVALYRTTSAAGDSGAAVLRASDHRVVGLHIGAIGPFGIFTPIHEIFSRFRLELA